MLQSGDVFVRKQPNGSYSAVRIIQTVEKSSLVCTSPFLANERPTLNEPLLREIVIQNWFFYKHKPAQKWLDGTPPKSFELL
jgi:hypothetical protein